MKKLVFIWLSPVLWMALIFYLSHQPAGVSSGISSGLARQLFEVVEPVVPVEFETIHTLLRKNAHFLAYFVLAILLVRALRKSGVGVTRAFVWAFVGSAVYAVSDEVHQLFIPGRSGEMRDVLIDSAGAAAGLVVYGVVSFFKWQQQKKAESQI
ncbi:VanZ family protein [Planococcus sp. ISL-109]|uniref:VanZ family protein n=1 Tax=Planococcus sp. ISL-109 TaxID=2819166 RepID=UPI001BE50029|nr:VanZ family protein [Planococcus sp. ISL-109]MBT2583958.1 VanZ family protein [Planococcus sp. ISL-109]